MANNNSIGVPNQNSNNLNTALPIQPVDVNDISVISTTLNSGVSPGIQTATPASMTGITTGTALTIDTLVSGLQETVIVISTTGTTFNAKFAFSHATNAPVALSLARQVMNIGDPTTYGSQASVATGVATTADTGLTVRPIPTPIPAGSASIGTVGLNTGANTIGNVNQAGTWNIGLNAGSNIVGKFGIDQTTPGTTNGVQINAALPAGTNTIGNVNINGTVPISGSVSLSGAIPAGSNSIGNVGLNAGTNIIGNIRIDQTIPGSTNGVQITGPGTSLANTLFNVGLGTFNTTPPTLTNAQTSSLQLDSSGNLLTHINFALPTGSNTIGNVGQSGTWNVGQSGTWNVGLSAGSNLAGGFQLYDSAGTNKASVSSVGALKVAIDGSTTSNVSVTGQTFDGSGNLNVDLKTAIPTGSNSIGNVGLNTGSNIVGKFGIDQTTPGTTNGVVVNSALPAGTNSLGTVGINTGTNSIGTVGLNAGTNIIGNFRIDQTTSGTTNGVQIVGPGTAIGNTLFASNVITFNSTPPTLTNGQTTTLQSDTNGNLKTNLATALPTGGNTIGAVNQAGTWNVGLSSGNNTIGTVNLGAQADLTSSGTITTSDAVVPAPTGNGALLSGTSTAGSYVFLALTGGTSVWDIQITGLTSGNLYFEGSLDSTNGINGNWVSVNGRQTGVLNTVLTYNPTTNGDFRGNSSGVAYIRVRAVGTLTGTPAIVIRASTGVGAVFLNASIPSGTNTIGNVNNYGIYNSSAPTLTSGNTSQVQLDVNANLKTTLATALPTGGNVIGSVAQSGTWNTTINTALPTGGNTIGNVGIVAGSATIGNVNQAGTWNVGLNAGTNIAGKFGIDQTTPGTTNGVQVNAALPAGANTIGNVGIVAGSAIIGNVRIDQTTPGTTNGVQINAALPTGANTIGAVNQNGTWNVGLSAGTNIVGNFRIDQTTPGNTNGVQITGPGSSSSNALFEQSIGVFNSTPPTLTNGQTAVIQLDTNGNQKVVLASALPAGANVIGAVNQNGTWNVGLSTGANTIGAVNQAGTWSVNQAGTWNVGLSAGSNIVGNFRIDQTTPGTTNGVQVNAALPTGGNTIGNVGIVAGSAIIGKVSIDQTTPGTTNAVQVSGPGTTTANPLFNQAGGTYNSSAPTLTSGNFSNLQLDVNGNLLTHMSTALPTGTNSIGTVGLNTGSNTIGNVNLNAGTNIVGNFRIDQTTPGTTNGVQITGPGASAGNNIFSQSIGVFSSAPPTLTNGQTSTIQLDTNGNTKVNLATALPAGSATIGNVGLVAGAATIGAVNLNAGSNIIGNIRIDQTTPGTTNGVQVNAALPTGANSIGTVGLNTGSNSIGTVGLNAGSNIVGSFRIDQTTAGTTNGVQITGPGTTSANTLFATPIGIYNSTAPTLSNGQVQQVQLDINGNTKVNLATALPTGGNVIGNVGQNGTWNVGLSTGTNSVGTVGLNAGTNIVGKFGIDQTTPGTTNGVQVNAALPTGTNSIGTVGLNAGTNVVGKFSIDQTTPGTTNLVQVSSASSGGATANPEFSRLQDGTTTNLAVVTSGGSLQTQSFNDSTTSTAYTAAAGNTVIKGSAGRLVSILVTTSPTTNVSIFDNATTNSGTIIGVVPAQAPIGFVQIFAAPAANGITVAGATTNGAFTVFTR